MLLLLCGETTPHVLLCHLLSWGGKAARRQLTWCTIQSGHRPPGDCHLYQATAPISSTLLMESKPPSSSAAPELDEVRWSVDEWTYKSRASVLAVDF